eukprot:COSAG02_NODE_2142_length_9685_cov_83.241707_10_plen_46_part_00
MARLGDEAKGDYVESRKEAIAHKRKAKRKVECLHFENTRRPQGVM